MAINIVYSIENPALIEGVEFARDQYNAGLSEDATPLTSEEYILFVGRAAVVSYAIAKVEHDFSTLGTITKAERDAKIAALSIVS